MDVVYKKRTVRVRAKAEDTIPVSEGNFFFFIYWPMILQIGDIVATPYLIHDMEYVTLDLYLDYLCNWWQVGLVTLCVLSLRWCHRNGFSALPYGSQQSIIWHLSNFCWWTPVDILAGLFKVNLTGHTEKYEILDRRHVIIPGEEISSDQQALFANYWIELFIHFPLSALCVWGFMTRQPSRLIIEAFVVGLQVITAINWYLPEFLNEGKRWSDSNTFFGTAVCMSLVWAIFPLYIFTRNIRLSGGFHSTKHVNAIMQYMRRQALENQDRTD